MSGVLSLLQITHVKKLSRLVISSSCPRSFVLIPTSSLSDTIGNSRFSSIKITRSLLLARPRLLGIDGFQRPIIIKRLTESLL